jgi:hypothetical protein
MKPGRLRTYLILSLMTIGLGCGCGVDRLQQDTLPNEITGLTLDELEQIQNDERLTDDEKRQAIRDATGAPEDSSGDRLVEFLLDLNIP